MSAVPAAAPLSSETIRAALSYIPAEDRDLWVRMGMAVKAELGEDGLALWDEWSQTAGNYNAADAKATWRSFKRGGITIASLIHEAKQHGFNAAGLDRVNDALEIARYRKERAEALAKVKAEADAKQAAAKERASALLEQAQGDPTTHPYVLRKKSLPFGSHARRGAWPQRGWTDALLIPIFQHDAEVWSIEAIPTEEDRASLPPGQKTDTLSGGRKSGGIFPIGRVSEAARVLIGEGVATMAACAASTGLPAVAALSAGNLKAAAETVLRLSPSAELIFVADNDPKPNGRNPGVEAALSAGRAFNAAVAIPDIGRQCDFWDVWSEQGPEAVKRMIEAAKRPHVDTPSDAPEQQHAELAAPRVDEVPPRIEAGNADSIWPQPLDLEALAEREPERPSFIIQDWGPAGYAWLLAGHGGVGKSGIALHLAVCLAAGIPFFGLDVERRRVCYLSCEDREDVLHWRLSRICAYLGVNLSTLRGWLEVFDLVSSDSVLWERDAKDGTTLRAAYFELQAHVRRHGGDVVLFVDGITDTYAGNENAKPEVKRYVRSLVRLIDPKRGAVLLIGHIAKPAAAGEPTSEGYSGTTAWHNSVRARWYLYPETQRSEDGKAEKTGELLLELQKSNLGRVDQAMSFCWDEQAHLFVGRQVTESAFDRKHRDREEQAGILASLKACAAAGLPVPAATTGQRTAYHVLAAAAEFPDALKGAGADKRRRFWRHVEALRHAGNIREAEHRKADRKIVLTLLPRN